MIRDIVRDWKEFFFSARANDGVVLARCAVCVSTALWLISFWQSVPIWFGPQGILATDLAATLIEYKELASWQMWSPLWLSDAVIVYYAWLALGLVWCVLGGLGIGGRWTFGLLVVWVIAWSHRIVWLIGLVEPALVAFIAYFLIEPGPVLPLLGAQRKFLGRPQEASWTATTTIRLLQIHWWILVAAGLLSQLASFIWWRGEAVWWLAAAGRSTLLTKEDLADRPLLVNGLTHGIIVVQILALWLITLRSTRPLGFGLGLAVCLALGLVADQRLYALVLASALLAYLPDITRNQAGGAA